MSAATVFDSGLFGNIFGTEEVRKCFSEESFVASMIRAECALAEAEELEGIIPSGVAAVIREHSDVSKIDWKLLASRTEIVGYPVLALVEQMSSWCPDEQSGYIHWGATTQDIMDLASVLQTRNGLAIVERLLHQVIATLQSMSATYRDVPMAGRTHLQHALPVTFGYKCAVWLASLQRHAERLEQIKERCLLVQFGGAAGTLASLGQDGVRVRKRLASVLGLRDPVITWHVARDTVAEVVNYLALIGGSLGKIALDLMIMSSNELNEVAEPYVPHRGASSTMPQKRNPISSEVILAQSKILRAQSGLVLDAMISDFERASGPWHLEWTALPTAFISVVGSLHQADFALSGLQVNDKAMLANLHSTRGLIVAEAVMMELAKFTGRQTAHDIVYHSCLAAHDGDSTLEDALAKEPLVTKHLTPEVITRLCDPTLYMGTCQLMVDEVLKQQKLGASVVKPGVNGATTTNGTNGVNGHGISGHAANGNGVNGHATNGH